MFEDIKMPNNLQLVFDKIDEYYNPLQWWKERKPIYPTLSPLAQRILAQSATSAPSERTFSVGGITIAKDRANLNPDHAEELIVLLENWENINEHLGR